MQDSLSYQPESSEQTCYTQSGSKKRKPLTMTPVLIPPCSKTDGSVDSEKIGRFLVPDPQGKPHLSNANDITSSTLQAP